MAEQREDGVGIRQLTEKHSQGRENQVKAIFANLFVVQNRLQTLFDREDGEITIKQFLLLVVLGQSGGRLTFTQLGAMLGCSRQNIKKLAASLEKKGFVSIRQNPDDVRACIVEPEPKFAAYFETMNKKHDGMLEALFSPYTDGEVGALFAAFLKMGEGIEALERFCKSAEK